MLLSNKIIRVGARPSPLSQVQLKEVLQELQFYHPDIVFESILIKSSGDLDKKTSLRTLGKTDFFTKEIDDLLLEGGCRIGIHSAKDLPEPLRAGLKIIAMTKGLNPADALVLRHDLSPENIPHNAVIATSSERREEAVQELFPHLKLRFVDLRGTIGERLKRLETGEADGVVVAEAALIRLGLTALNRVMLPGDTTAFQGRLAVIAREDDVEMMELFKPIHYSP